MEDDHRRSSYVTVAVPPNAVVVTEQQLEQMHAINQIDGSLKTIDGKLIYVLRLIELPEK